MRSTRSVFFEQMLKAPDRSPAQSKALLEDLWKECRAQIVARPSSGRIETLNWIAIFTKA